MVTSIPRASDRRNSSEKARKMNERDAYFTAGEIWSGDMVGLEACDRLGLNAAASVLSQDAWDRVRPLPREYSIWTYIRGVVTWKSPEVELESRFIYIYIYIDE